MSTANRAFEFDKGGVGDKFDLAAQLVFVTVASAVALLPPPRVPVMPDAAQDAGAAAAAAPPHVACADAREKYDACVRASLRSFLGGADPQAVSCELAADVLRVCLARSARRRGGAVADAAAGGAPAAGDAPAAGAAL